jgi:phage repressor protein C with HTH and peptisase S24 domain
MAKYASMVVEGDSMAPTYNAGDWLMGRWADYKVSGVNRIKAGDVVVIERDEQPGIFYVKRISEVRNSKDETPTIYLLSDNEAGTDSRSWGWLPVTSVRAKIQFRIKRAK